MLARLQRGDRHQQWSRKSARLICCTEIDVRIGQNVFVFRKPLFDLEGIANLLEFFRIPLTNGVHVGVRMPLEYGNEFRSESQSDDRHVDFFLVHVESLGREVLILISATMDLCRAIFNDYQGTAIFIAAATSPSSFKWSRCRGIPSERHRTARCHSSSPGSVTRSNPGCVSRPRMSAIVRSISS